MTLVATLNVPFTAEDGLGDNAGKNRIVLRQVTKRFSVGGVLVAHCFPSSGVTFVASVGTVEQKEQRYLTQWEGIKFSDSSEVSLKYPGAINVVLNTSISVLMEKTTNAQGDTIIRPASGVTLVWDATTEQVKAQTSLGKPVKVYGACFVSYDVDYRVLYYKPGAVATNVGGGSYAFVWTTGTIFGYNNYSVQTLDMELDISSPPEWVEFGRVTSKIVLDSRGVWEYPESWDSTYESNRNKLPDAKADFNIGTFTHFTNTYEIDPDQSFTDERVHCIIRVNTTGVTQYEDFNNGGDGYTFWNMPYQNLTSYHPKYEVKWSDPPGGKKASNAEDFKRSLNNRNWRDVFLEVDKDSIKDKIREEYPGIKDSNGTVI